jgi:hypothetical protein
MLAQLFLQFLNIVLSSLDSCVHHVKFKDAVESSKKLRHVQHVSGLKMQKIMHCRTATCEEFRTDGFLGILRQTFRLF